jgi:diguanylate cyclase (GGDEF)-like protein
MLPEWVKKLGHRKLVIFTTVVSILISIGVSCILGWLLHNDFSLTGLLIATVVPLIITPSIGIVFFRAYFELEEVKTKLAHLSVTDDLTQVYNRRYFIGRAHYELARAKRYGHAFSMLLFDLDDFKQINDQYGHPAGDEVLCMVANTCLRESREVDVLARYGGDEFALLIPALQKEQAVQYADRLRRILGESKIEYEGHQLQTTASVGVVTWTPAITELERLIYLMDKALYAAKRAGKDTLRVSGIEGEYSAFIDIEETKGQ